MRSSKTPDRLGALFFVLTLLVTSPAQSAASRQEAWVEDAVSGDTVRLRGGKLLRYAGLESPAAESSNPLIREYGLAALEFNRSLVKGQKIHIEWGPQIRDKNNRLLGYAYLEDGRLLSRLILQNGHAKMRVIPPNLRHAESFREDELGARRAKRGLWLKEPDDPNLSSAVLGNKVGKIYYYPNSPELEDVPEAQLVRFRSRVEAKAAGYRPCYSCRNHSSESSEQA